MIRILAAYTFIVLIIEIIIFNIWLYLTTKNTKLAEKYWINYFDTKDTEGLSKGQTFLLKTISLSKLLVITLLILHILTIIINSF